MPSLKADRQKLPIMLTFQLIILFNHTYIIGHFKGCDVVKYENLLKSTL